MEAMAFHPLKASTGNEWWQRTTFCSTLQVSESSSPNSTPAKWKTSEKEVLFPEDWENIPS
jgi:hypothetical protein